MDTSKNNITNRAIKYELFPTNEQKVQIARTFGCVRSVYNMGLELQQGLYEAGFGSMSFIELNNYCNHAWKEEFPFLRDVDKFALNNSLKHLDFAFKSFFEKRGKYPRFKSRKNSTQSYTTNITGNNIAIVFPKRSSHRGKVKLPKLGLVDACIYRYPKEDWVIKQATVELDYRGRYWVSILFAFEQKPIEPVVPTKDTTLGLDYSNPHFYVDSNNESADMPHYYRKTEARLAREQRKLSHMEKDSKNYRKQVLRVARLHGTIANQRMNFCHQLSRKITNSYDAVCVEDLNLKAMASSLDLGKATLDNGFGMFRNFLKYKLEEQGKHYIVIDKWYPSTKTCHECGAHNPDVKLGQQEWTCPHCGKPIQRDYNAALNIRDEGFRMLQERTVA